MGAPAWKTVTMNFISSMRICIMPVRLHVLLIELNLESDFLSRLYHYHCLPCNDHLMYRWLRLIWKLLVSVWILTSSNRAGSPQDETRIQNSFTPVQNTSHQIESLSNSLLCQN